MDDHSDPNRLTPSATMRFLQGLAREEDRRPAGLRGDGRLYVDDRHGDAGTARHMQILTVASSHYLDDSDRDTEVIDLRDTDLPLVSEETVLGRIPPISSSGVRSF